MRKLAGTILFICVCFTSCTNLDSFSWSKHAGRVQPGTDWQQSGGLASSGAQANPAPESPAPESPAPEPPARTQTGAGLTSSASQAQLATDAHQILVTHCGKCHGKGGSYSDEMLLDYPKLVGGDEPILLKGKVDGSFLYETIADGDMPPKKAKNPVPADKLAVLKKWIEAGAPDWNLAPKPKRKFITNEEISRKVLEDLKKQPIRDRRFIRYYTLTHLYNAGESDDAMENYRLALAKLVNSLSWEQEITKPIPIDPEKTILRVNLHDFGWDLSIWAKIIARYPYVAQNENEPFEQARELTRAEVPFLRGDWFISNAALPPLYHEILDLPETDKELEDRLGVNVARNLSDSPGRKVWRSGFLESGVSNFNRIVERHQMPYGAYWKSYDFDSNKGRKNIFENPRDFEHAGGEIIWNLPNGLQAYLLVDSSGKRLDEAPVNIVFTTQGRDPVIRNGLSCMACHTSGMKEFKDRSGELHLDILETPYDDAGDKELALALYPEAKAINALVEKDKKTFENAVEKLGGIIGNREPIELLTDLFQDTLTVKMAAAEVGMEESVFLNRLKNPSLKKAESLSPLKSLSTLLNRLKNPSLKKAESLSTLKSLSTLVSGGKIAREVWEDYFPIVIASLEVPLASVNEAADKAFNEGRYAKAARLYAAELTAEEAKTAPNSMQLSYLYSSLGDALYLGGGQTDKALECYQQALTIDLKQLGENHIFVTHDYDAIGRIYNNDKGEHYKAQRLFMKSLAIRLKQLGPDHLDVGSSYFEIGSAYLNLEKYDKALEYYQKALTIDLKELGADHHDVGSNYYNTGLVYYNKDEYDKALEFYQKARAIWLKQLGPDDPHLADLYRNTSLVYEVKKDLLKALEYMGYSYAIRLKNLGANHADTKNDKAELDALTKELKNK